MGRTTKRVRVEGTVREPPYEDAKKVFSLRCKSKRGETISKEEMAFCESIMKKYPKWYGSLDSKVFVATAPFGAL